MNAKNIISALVIGIIGVIIGAVGSEKLFCKKDCKETCSTEKEMTFREKLNALLKYNTSNEDLKFSPIEASQNENTSLELAHRYSRNFRQNSNNNFCQIPDAQGKIKVNPNQLGFFEISIDNAKDMLDAINTIQANADPKNVPNKFRLINGKLSSNPTLKDGVLLIVPIDSNGIEITKDAHSKSSVYKLDYPIDCPTRCDYKNSTIITKGTNPTPNPCI